MAQANGCEVEVDVDWFTTPLVNKAEQVGVALTAASHVVEPTRIDGDIAPVTAGEDFAAMMEAKPGAFMFIGNGPASDGKYHPVHTPKFDFNDEIIPFGCAYWIALVRTQ